MTIIITMVGLGSRFKNAGYAEPKYMIQAKGKSLFEWSMDSLIGYNEHVSKYIFVVRKEDHAREFIQQICAERGLKLIAIIEIDYLTDGQATTAMLAMPYCEADDAIMIYNIDTYVETGEMKYADLTGDGHIPCFHAEGTHWSFVKTDQDGQAIEVKEKVRISDNCTLGAYYFSSAKLYAQLYEEYYAQGRKEQKERYVAPLYHYMIEQHMSVTISIINAEKVHVLGTPQELKVFLET